VICKLEMPLIDPSLRGGRVLRWSKKVGDEISFGDELCVVALDEFAALRRTARATLLAGQRRTKLKSDLEVRAGKVLLEVVIVSSDQGVLRNIIKNNGDQIAIGDTLAIVSSHVNDDLGDESEWVKAPMLRVVANPVDDNQDFEEGD
jgi:pyruvate/2-oxoglutarate dehydrogenase complex dihydrolipoamide acyltransferase (E2) component